MPAASIAELLDFETQFEAAAQAILEENQIAAYISEQQQKLPTTHAGVSFDTGAAIDNLTLLPLGGQASQVQQDFYRYVGTLELMVSVARDQARPATDDGVTTFLAQCRGRIRAAFMMSQWPFDNTNLPYYRVSEIKPMGTTTGQNQQLNTDVLAMRFQVTFAIQPTAWPTGFPPS